MMASVNWLEGQGKAGPERICPRRHILQTEWQPTWNNGFPVHYDYISDYECIFPHPIRQSERRRGDRDLWGDLKAAKQQGCGIAIENVAHFTTPEIAQIIVDSSGFKGGLKKINENENGEPVLEQFSWWSPIFQDDNVHMVQQHLKEVLTPFCLQHCDDIDRISTQFASSDAFLPKPLLNRSVYFKCTIEELCNFYKAYIPNGLLQFRVLGTFLHKKEIMHAVLVCGEENGNDLFANYPLISNQGNVVTRDGDGNWTWYPQATGTGKIIRLARYPTLPKYRRWDHICFAFHMRQGNVMRVDNLPGRRYELPMR